MREYRRHLKNENWVIFYALRKYGIHNFEVIILELTEGMPNQEILLRESLWIKFYFSLTPYEKGYNVCPHSNDSTGIKRKFIKRKPRSEETKEKLRIKALQRNTFGNKNPFYGKKHSAETIAKISKAKTGKTNTVGSKPVKQLDCQGNLIKIWPSASEAGRYLGNSNKNSKISLVCTQRKDKRGYTRSKAFGYRWEYV
jgi:group I intron endonuclease